MAVETPLEQVVATLAGGSEMNIVTEREAVEWCRRHGCPLNNSGLPAVRHTTDAPHLSIPSDAGKRTALVKDQMSRLAIDNSCLVWLDDWNVWPSGQWHHLFERFRLSYGCPNPLIEKPAHIVEKTEFDAAVSIAVYAVLMLWDCYVITDSGAWVYYSHDEMAFFSQCYQ
jgi:hypothetical protein